MKEMLDKRLKKNGWRWTLVSTLTEDMVRVQIAPIGEGFEDRIKCFTERTLEEAVNAAENYILDKGE